jgi:hypothetical protein
VSWRQAALYYFSKQEYDGAIFIPEPAPAQSWDWKYEDQIEWEEQHLQAAKCIMFWIPRNMKDMPGLTTNVEWGVWQKSGKVILGYPDGAQKMRYIEHYAQKYNISTYDNLELTVKAAINMSHKRHKEPCEETLCGDLTRRAGR